MKIENIRIFNHNEEIHGFLKSELLKVFSEIGDYKVYDKIEQYEYLCIRIISFFFIKKESYQTQKTNILYHLVTQMRKIII